MRLKGQFIWILAGLLAVSGCKRDPDIIPDNDAPYYASTPTVLLRNYINRLYIDLIGREPLDTEMDADVLFLRDRDISPEARRELVVRLQTDTAFIEGDSSYRHAYYQRLYDLGKVRLLEGVSDDEVNQQIGIYYADYVKDSLNGDAAGVAENKLQIGKLRDILRSKKEYRTGVIGHEEMMARMLDNYFYDLINMNTFNFVNASYDDLFFRYPTSNEFSVAFDIIEFNQAGIVAGLSAQNKEEYIDILVHSPEYYEGMIIWTYETLLAREPSTAETYNLMIDFTQDHDLQKVQQEVLISDEYANF